jgi:DNA-binding transcriptional LysR family regulator
LGHISLDALADFVAVASNKGFGKASRVTGRSKSTLSRRVAELELALKVRLVERSSTAFRLTREGEVLFSRTSGQIIDLVQASEDLRTDGGPLSGHIRLSAPVRLAHMALGQLAAKFIEMHPGVQLEIIAEDRTVDLIDEGYDLVIRANPKANETLVGRRFVTDRTLVVAPAKLAKPQGDEAVPAVVHPQAISEPWKAETPEGEKEYAIRPVLFLSSITMILNAVRSGAGAALLPQSLVYEALDAGEIVSWGTLKAPSIEVWVLHTSRRLISPRVNGFVQFLISQFPDGTMESGRALFK